MRTKVEEMTAFWRKFDMLAGSGVPVLRLLRVLKDEAEDVALREAIEGIVVAIEKGSPLSETLTRYPAWFSASVVTMVKAGEVNGALEEAARRIAEGLANGSLLAESQGEQPVSVSASASSEGPNPIMIVNHLLLDAFNRNATDIHIEINGEEARVRLRVDGNLRDQPPVLTGPAVQGMANRIRILVGLDTRGRGKALDGRFQFKVRESVVDVRLSIVPTMSGESIVMRLLSRDVAAKIPTVDQLGISPGTLERIQSIIRQPRGLVVVSGPTGSGKTTTLYSIFQTLNVPECKMVTVEDPVAYILPGANHVQVNPAAGFTFAAAMRSVAEQDPDILLVGEIRDRETAQLSLQSALTGHVVLTAMHANDAVDTVRRLMETCDEPYLLSGALAGVISQRLFRKICPHCKEAVEAPASLAAALGERAKQTYYRGKGCDRCTAGYKARLAVQEVLVVDDKLRKLVADGADAAAIRAQAMAGGMVPMRDAAIEKALEGVTTLDEVWRVCQGL